MLHSKPPRSRALRHVVMTGIGALFCCTLIMACQKTQADEVDATSERSYPSLPGAVRECPEWLKKNVPFDIDEWFAVVPPEENAAPLYLDALYEFAPLDMAKCMSPAALAARGAAVNGRAARTAAGLAANALSRDLVAEHVVAFDKLAIAQQHKRCLFETGIGLDALLPHAQSSRAVIRVLDWRIEYAVGNGRIDQAIADIGMGLRLSRDLRPRGYLISQLVSVALDSVILQSMVPKILGARGLTIAQCDRLLQVLARHVDEAVESLSEGFRAEYVSLRDILHRYETGSETVAALMLDEEVDNVLQGFTAADYEAEVEALNRFFRPLVERRNRLPREFVSLEPDLIRAAEGLKALRSLVTGVMQSVEARRRDVTRIPGTQCLVAVRRWQLEHSGKSPPNLLTACKAAGIKAVPPDEYSPTGEPLRYTKINGEFIVYSVAKDGVDDGAKMDWNYGQTPGDWIFRLPPVR